MPKLTLVLALAAFALVFTIATPSAYAAEAVDPSAPDLPLYNADIHSEKIVGSGTPISRIVMVLAHEHNLSVDQFYLYNPQWLAISQKVLNRDVILGYLTGPPQPLVASN